MQFIQTALSAAVREGVSRTAGLLAWYIVAAITGTLAFVSLVILLAWWVADQYGHLAGLGTAAGAFFVAACLALIWIKVSNQPEIKEHAPKSEARVPARRETTALSRSPAMSTRTNPASAGPMVNADTLSALAIVGAGVLIATGPFRAMRLIGKAYWLWSVSRPVREFLNTRGGGR